MSYNFTDIPNSSLLTKNELMKQIVENLTLKAEEDYKTLNNLDIGKIIITCTKINSNEYIELNGQLLIKEHYPDLFNVYQNKFEKDYPTEFNKEVYFAVPDCRTRALIMQDADGILDSQLRAIGSNLDWRLNLDKLLDFDITNQIKVAKNITDKSEASNENKNVFTITQHGSNAYLVTESKKYQLKDLNNEYLQTLNNKLQFDSIHLYFYTRCGRNLTPQQ